MCRGMANAHHRISVDVMHTSLRSPAVVCFLLAINIIIITIISFLRRRRASEPSHVMAWLQRVFAV